MLHALLALILLIAPSLAFADAASDALAKCESYPDVPVYVTPRFDAPAYDYNHSITEIMVKSADAYHSIREGISLGLTQYGPIIEIKAPLIGVIPPDGPGCAFVDHVDVTIGYENVVVYIAHEIPPDTCGFNEIMAHEQKHIEVNRLILQAYVPRIQAELSAYLKVHGVRREEDTNYAMHLVQEELHAIIKSLLQEMSAENESLQRNVDTPAEYQRITDSCNGQLRAISAQYRGR